MKYETPELTALTPAINASQAIKVQPQSCEDVPLCYLTELPLGAYEDWE